MIKFLCPSGHELSADERLAGKPGKCPKCQVRFLIPEMPGEEEPDAEFPSQTDDDMSPPPPAGHDSSIEVERAAPLAAVPTTVPAAPPATPPSFSPATPPPSPPSPPTPAATETFAFLCPNGHKLSGPLSLQGKPGQCPHCQERFLIPVLDDFEPEMEEPPPATADSYEADETDEDDETPLEQGSSSDFDGPSEIPEGVALDDADGFASAWSDLWPLRAGDEPLEVYFSGGSVELVHRYAAHPNDPSLVLLATREDDGRFTIIAARWSSILRVAVRRCEKLPKAWFGP